MQKQSTPIIYQPLRLFHEDLTFCETFVDIYI